MLINISCKIILNSRQNFDFHMLSINCIMVSI